MVWLLAADEERGGYCEAWQLLVDVGETDAVDFGLLFLDAARDLVGMVVSPCRDEFSEGDGRRGLALAAEVSGRIPGHEGSSGGWFRLEVGLEIHELAGLSIDSWERALLDRAHEVVVSEALQPHGRVHFHFGEGVLAV